MSAGAVAEPGRRGLGWEFRLTPLMKIRSRTKRGLIRILPFLETSSLRRAGARRLVLFVSGACCAVRTATIRTPGISRTAPTYPSITCSAGSAICARASKPRRGADDIGRRTHGAACLCSECLPEAKEMGLHTAVQTSGFLGDRADDSYLSVIDHVFARHQEFGSTYRRVTAGDPERPLAICRARYMSSRSGSFPACASALLLLLRPAAAAATTAAATSSSSPSPFFFAFFAPLPL